MFNWIREKKHKDKLIKDAQKGSKFLKHGRMGKPHAKFVFVTQAVDGLSYKEYNNTKEQPTLIPFSEFTEVSKGANSKVFQRNIPKKELTTRGEKCLSFIGAKRTFDLECSSQKERDEWYDAFRAAFEAWKFANSGETQKNKKADVDKCLAALKKFAFEIESSQWKISRVLTKTAKFSDEDYMYLVMSMEGNPILTHLDLTDVGVNDNQCQYLAPGLTGATNLQYLNLSNNNITGDGMSAIAKGLKSHKNIKILDLRNNAITDNGLEELAFAINENRSVEEIYMDKNNISDEGACSLADSLKTHASIKVVSLTENQISNKGAKALCSVLKAKKAPKLEAVRLAHNNIVFPKIKKSEEDTVDEDGEESLEVSLFLAVDGNEYAEAVLLLLQGADINVQNEEDGRTPLHIAAIRGDMHMVQFLCDHPGLDINTIDDQGTTALYSAMENKQYEIVKLLLEKKADHRIGDKHKKTVLHLACEQGEKNITKLLIETYKADLNVTTTSDITPLHLAAQNLHKPIVEYLLLRDEQERKEFYEKSKKNAEETVEDAYVNWQDILGETPLHKVFNNGKYDVEIAKLLISKGADISIEDNHQRTAIQDLPPEVKEVLLQATREMMAKRQR